MKKYKQRAIHKKAVFHEDAMLTIGPLKTKV